MDLTNSTPTTDLQQMFWNNLNMELDTTALDSTDLFSQPSNVSTNMLWNSSEQLTINKFLTQIIQSTIREALPSRQQLAHMISANNPNNNNEPSNEYGVFADQWDIVIKNQNATFYDLHHILNRWYVEDPFGSNIRYVCTEIAHIKNDKRGLWVISYDKRDKLGQVDRNYSFFLLYAPGL